MMVYSLHLQRASATGRAGSEPGVGRGWVRSRDAGLVPAGVGSVPASHGANHARRQRTGRGWAAAYRRT